jgi:hypothetical protein
VESTNIFKIILVVMLFYSFATTVIAYSLPESAVEYTDAFTNFQGGNVSMEGISNDVQESLEQQTDIPVIELGALVFYSGNILLDLLVNFAFAIPGMLSALLNGILYLVGIDAILAYHLQAFLTAVMVALYFFALIQLITGLRSGQRVS